MHHGAAGGPGLRPHNLPRRRFCGAERRQERQGHKQQEENGRWLGGELGRRWKDQGTRGLGTGCVRAERRGACARMLRVRVGEGAMVSGEPGGWGTPAPHVDGPDGTMAQLAPFDMMVADLGF